LRSPGDHRPRPHHRIRHIERTHRRIRPRRRRTTPVPRRCLLGDHSERPAASRSMMKGHALNALPALIRSEATLLSRNPTAIFMALLFPTALLLLQGLVIPGTGEALGGDDPAFAQLRAIDLFIPIALTVALGSVTLTNFPSAIGGYREKGVLRRLATTPVGPQRVLIAQVILSGVALVLGAAIAVAASVMLLDAQPPRSVFFVVGIFALAAVQMLCIGSLIAARASTAQNANGVGMLIFFGCLFTAGVWTPGP